MVKRLRTAVTRVFIERRERIVLSTFASVGPGTRLGVGVTVTGGQSVSVGANVHIGSGAFIRAEGGLSIGNNTQIGRNLVLYTHNHEFEGSALPFDSERRLKPVHIGRNVWIGMNVCIAPGAQIGDGAIIGMGTVVVGVVPRMAIIGSHGWRLLGERDRAHYENLDSSDDTR